ncbi:hypothetical protein [uncultured Anaerococcus sp.]|uniref:hypothetical protein n=1 Tax=uncultured Anaerococcus sp. TaxID=293428 RepID=UPI002804126B|nr:hypothetical protein [uncultured Anaerococcus sp.]
MRELYNLLGIAGIIAVLCAAKYAIDLAKAKKDEITDSRARGIIDVLIKLMDAAVKEANQEVVDELKSNPEKLFDKEKQVEIFNSVVDKVKLWLGDEQKDIVAKYLGGARKLEDFIESEVSAKVRDNKKPKQEISLNVSGNTKGKVGGNFKTDSAK